MPTVLEETDVSLDRADLLSRSPITLPVGERGRIKASSRAAGMHLSGVLRYVAVTTGLLRVVEDIDEEMLPLRMALGHAWEEFAASLYADFDWQPGQITVDGISMNCDGLGWQNGIAGQMAGQGSNRLEEFKLTWKRMKTADEMLRGEWYWMQQGRGYCWGYEARLVRWHICYVNGDYRGGGPVYKRCLIRFTDQEVESTRKMILKHKDSAEQKGHAE